MNTAPTIKHPSSPVETYDSSFRILFDLSVQGIFIEDSYGNIIDCNAAGCKMFGYNPGELIGVNIKQLVPEQFANNLPEEISEEMTTGDIYVERVNMKKDGTLFATEICTKYTMLNGEKRLIAFIHDISAQKKIQQDLVESNKELEKAIAIKQKFFSIISHDLKSPMEAILGFTELLDDEIENPSAKIKLYLDNLKNATNASYELLDNLLQWTICQTKKIKPLIETFKTGTVCKNTIILLENIANKKDIKLINNIPEGVTITTDKNMLQFIIRNLVVNAIKYTHPGGTINVLAIDLRNRVQFIISDNGIGMSPQKIKSILTENEYTCTPGTKNEKGTGLGLKICNEFLKLLQSEIKIESEINKGSRFIFDLSKQQVIS